MILVDTSVWLAVGRQLKRVTDVVDPHEAAVCGPVLYEVLRGARPSAYWPLQDRLYSAHMLDDPMPMERYDYAASVYSTLRARGVTIGSPLDCIIAAVAMSNSAELLHMDRDYDQIARFFPLHARNVLP